jgi:hypothetical protein
MERAQVKKLAKKILDQYQRQGVLNNAVAMSKSGELFQIAGY